jgi:hypothetical protein
MNWFDKLLHSNIDPTMSEEEKQECVRITEHLGDGSYYDRLRGDGYIKVANRRVGLAMRDIYIQSGCQMTTVDTGENDCIEKYLVEGVTICYSCDADDNNYIDGPFAKDKKDFILATSKLVERMFGKYISLNGSSIVEGYNRERGLCLESFNIYDDAYVSRNDEEGFVKSIKSFFKLKLNRSVLFYGPPGSGKSTFALRMAEKLDGKMLIINGWSMSNRSVGSIYNVVEIVNPEIILFDDLDRVDNVSILLSDLEMMNKESNYGNRLLIATVNSIGDIPEALRRPGRFDQLIKFDDHLNKNTCRNILMAHSKHKGLVLSEDELELLTELSFGMSGAYLKEIILRVLVLGMSNIEEHIKNMRSAIE